MMVESQVQVRPAVEGDVDQIRDLFLETYGDDYAYPQYYDRDWLKKLVYGDDTLLLVAEQVSSGHILGTASVVMHVGAYNDLLGEFGRLVVRNDARGHGVGKALMKGRIERVQDRLHVGVVENRVAHPFSQRISVSHGFAPVGFIPNKLRIKTRECVSLYLKHFGPALSLRRNHPHVIPEVHRLANMALSSCGLEPDAIVEEQAQSYPHIDEFDLDELTTEGYASLLRLQRGRTQTREIFGPMRLHYGLFKLRVRHSHYLLAKQQDQVVGGIGFIIDDIERAIRIFELVSNTEQPIRFLLHQLLAQCQERWKTEYLEIDVNAHAPRMQRTLLELGFLPVAYIPAMVFHDVERLDVVKMSRLLVPVDLEGIQLLEPTEPFAELVRQMFVTRQIQPRVASAIPSIDLFRDLSQEQIGRLAAECQLGRYTDGDQLFVEGQTDCAIHLILSGSVSVTRQGSPQPIASAQTGECLGEMSLVAAGEHSATLTACGSVETAMLTHDRLNELIRRRPDIGLVVYRNLAKGLATKLRRTNECQSKT